jgi:O-acetyl-ADP-ribose deacetylase (regulator of RNase III)
MIEVITGDILSLREGILVHGCNCQGVMGGGIAKLIRDNWPGVYSAYKSKHFKSGLQLGDVQPVCNLQRNSFNSQNPKAIWHALNNADDLPPELIVVNAMTQFDYGRVKDAVYVDYDAVFAAFARINMLARDSGLAVNFPLIGCGLANGKWEWVSNAIERAMDPGTKLLLWKLP